MIALAYFFTTIAKWKTTLVIFAFYDIFLFRTTQLNFLDTKYAFKLRVRVWTKMLIETVLIVKFL